MLSNLQIDKTWTLFLDRDGVINIEKQKDYIRHVSEFVFYEEVLKNFHKLSDFFAKVIVVTNQRGIGKGLMTHEDLQDIHLHLQQEVTQHKGRIDAFFYAPELDHDAINRKPNIGMGLQAKKLFPDIDFTKSIMVGNNLSDMEFGKRLGMKTVYVETTQTLAEAHEFVDVKADSLVHFITLLAEVSF